MPRLSSLFLLCLTLLAACKKAPVQPEPEPALAGRWNRNVFAYTDYDPAGKVVATTEDQLAGQGLYFTFSADTIRYFENQVLLSSSRYAREGSVLHVTHYNVNLRQTEKYDLTIAELTDAKLVFQRRLVGPSGYYSITTTTCGR
ncbi:hypothetical protein [Hymenobacter chitinivorans]|uniref:Lipocalin-like protein n=1 Tax=Hymenobacter chitinivorans DSM 11115 TaxID=1121954 RepID=A0A2M9BRN1_9BACT|nr:hypothetical protein [Hymenobacter chitinivorans]PJJ60605.1 hypothetical protein CLV45_2034 [Hymenobacter chitinivorans DSM 11115]